MSHVPVHTENNYNDKDVLLKKVGNRLIYPQNNEI